MKTAAIEINDAAVALASEGGLQPPSPGYALLNASGVIVGDAARKAARLDPRNIDNRFWHELSEKSLSLPAAGGRSRADLAYAQLKQLWEAASLSGIQAVACSVPATMRPAQLALILGVARACEVPLSGFIDSAVAAATVWDGRGRFVYVDVHLHQAICTAVEVGAEARRERFDVAGRAGLIGLQDAWMRMISRLFVTRTRFDPLHQAGTEQMLFDALPECLATLAMQPQAEVEIAFGADKHRVTVTREEFLLESQPIYGQILLSAHRLRRAGHPLTIALSAGAAALPGLAERFTEFKDSEIVRCAPGCSAMAAAIHAAQWPVSQESATLFRAARPLQGVAVAALAPTKIQTAQQTNQRRAPTHVIYKGKAHALGSQPLVAGLDAGESRLQVTDAIAGISPLHCSILRGRDEAEVIDYSRYGTWLNDERVTGRAPLHAGDRIRLGSPGAVLELIAID